MRSGRMFLLAILAVAALLRVHRINALELWHDEVNSLFEARGLNYLTPGPGFTRSDLHAYNTLGNVIDACVFIDSGNASLYVVILHYWSLLVGVEPGMLRLLSVLFGLLGILLVHRLACDLFRDDRIALLSAAIVALMPVLISQSQQLRSYTLAVSLSLWATVLLFRLIRAERAGAWSVLLYGLVVTGSMLSHYSTCYILLAHPLVALIMRTPSRRILRIGGGGVVAVLLFMTWMVLAGSDGLEQMSAYNQDYLDKLKADPGLVSFFAATTPATIVEGWVVQLLAITGNDLRFSGPPLRVIALMLIIPIALVAMLVVPRKKGPEARILLALVVLGLASMIYATLLALTSGHTVSLQPHYAVFGAPYAAILLGAAIGRAGSMPRSQRHAAIGLAATFTLITLLSLTIVPAARSSAPNEYGMQRERLRSALIRYGTDKVVAVHSSTSAAYQSALYADAIANDLPNYVNPAYPEISGILIERGHDRWMLTIRPRLEQFHRSVPLDEHTWHLDYGPAPALPDSIDAWRPTGVPWPALSGKE